MNSCRQSLLRVCCTILSPNIVLLFQQQRLVQNMYWAMEVTQVSPVSDHPTVPTPFPRTRPSYRLLNHADGPPMTLKSMPASLWPASPYTL